MSTSLLCAHIDKELKKDAERILDKLGATPSEAIQAFYNQIILTGGIPFPYEKIAIADDDIYSLFNQLETVKKDIVTEIPKALSNDCRKIILFGSCARGDYRDESDVDVAILIYCDREQVGKYDSAVDNIAMYIGDKTGVVVNFVLLPYEEYEAKKSWYPFFMNIENEGIVLYEN